MKNFYLILFFVLIVGNIYAYQAIFSPRVLEVSVLDVGPPAGGGDATLVHTPNGKTLLIDTGPDASILRALGTALPPWQRRIDAIVLTSEKSGAVKGLQDIMSRYHVSTPILFGTSDIPYGTHIALDGVYVDILYAGMLNISYGPTSLSISSTTPKGTYISDGKTITKTTQ